MNGFQLQSNKNGESHAHKVFVLFMFLAAFFVGALVGGVTLKAIRESELREEAVKNGVGHWEVAPNGRTTFHWGAK